MQEIMTRRDALLNESLAGIRKLALSLNDLTDAIIALDGMRKKLWAYCEALSDDVKDEAQDKHDFLRLDGNIGAATKLLVSPLGPSLDQLELAMHRIEAAKACI